MGFQGQPIDTLDIPGKAEGAGVRVFAEPPVVMPTSLAQPFTAFGKCDKRHEQDIGSDTLRPRTRLEDAEGAYLAIAFLEGIGKGRKFHRSVRGCKAGQGQGVACLEEEARVGCGRGLERIGPVEPDCRALRYQVQQWSGRAVEYKRAHTVRHRSDMLMALGAIVLPEF